MKKIISLFLSIVSTSLFLGMVSTVSAQEGERDQFTLEEIVVTSQKRTERLQETTISASVLSESTIADSNVSEIIDLNNIVPSLQLKSTFNGRVPIAMRGISTNVSENTIGLTSGVSISVDGVPVPADAMGVNQLGDVQRVEVVRGPQSTLGGRAASAGALNIVTKRPSATFTGSAGITATTDNQLRLQGYLSGPISDTLKFNISGVKDDRDFPVKNLYNGKTSNLDSYSVRAKVLWEPNENLSFTLAGHAGSVDTEGGNYVYQYVTPGASLFPMIPPGIPQSEALPGIDVHWGNTEYYSPVTDMRQEVDAKDMSFTIDYDLGRYTLSSITGYQNEERTNVQDITISAVYFFNELTHHMAPPWYNRMELWTEPTSFTQELKIVSPAEDPINFVAGLFYSDVEVEGQWTREWVANGIDFYRDSVTKSLAAYGRVTWELWDSTKLITGLRYNRDKLSYSAIQGANLPYIPYFAPPKAEDTSSTVVGDITVQHTLNEYSMLYGTYARGYKPRVFNTAETLTSNTLPDPVEKETIDHFELGAKTTWLNGKLVANASLFDTIYKGYQVQVWTAEASGELENPIPVLKLRNAGEAETRGVELDLNARPTYDMTLNLNLAYIDAKFNDFKNAPAWPTQTEAEGASLVPDSAPPKFEQDLSGKPMPDSPKFKVNFGVEQRIPQDSLPFDIFLGGQYSYRTEAYILADQNPRAKQSAFGLLNLNVKAVSLSEKYSLTLFVNNVFDKFYVTSAQDFFSGLWGPTSVAIIGNPARDSARYAGITFNAKF